MMDLLRIIPKNYLSFGLGWLSSIDLPNPFRKMLVRWFADRYHINVSEASRPLASYRSIADFFTRDLRAGVRPIAGDLVCPVDGTLRNEGPILEGVIEQIKGVNYSVVDLLGDRSEAEKFTGGRYFNLYLSPQDYHHVHSPVTGYVRKVVAIPGRLWPVNDWSINAIKNLFAVNERVAIYISSEKGEAAVVMVGATNVGKISLAFDNLFTNTTPWRSPEQIVREYEEGKKSISAGDRVGTFNLGSSVVLLFDQRLSSRLRSVYASPIKTAYGESLAAL